jgi:lipid-binding SYLF domain-containing protein
MSSRIFDKRVVVGACCFALASLSASALAVGTNNAGQPNNMATPGATTAKAARDEARKAQGQVDAATKIVRTMERDPHAAKLLHQAHGVFVITRYGSAALGIGGRGGEGVMMVKRDGTWSDPAFYNTGGVSIGAQAGAEGGSMVFVLNTGKAVDAFKHKNNWSFNAEAGLTVVNWSEMVQGSAGKSDVTIWANTKGLLGSLAVSVTDIQYDRGETSAFYGKPMKVADVFSGNAQPKGDVAELRDALAGATAAAASNVSNKSAVNMAGNSNASTTANPNAHRTN